jgi:hypothetical protein
VMNGLQGRILDQLDIGLTPSEIFALFDESKKGSIDLISLMQGGRELGVTMSRAEGRNVIRRLSFLAGGVIDKGSFFEALGIEVGKKKKDSVGFRMDEDEPPLGIMRALKSLSKQVSKPCSFNSCESQLNFTNNEIRATKILRGALESEDKDGDGYLNRPEFSRYDDYLLSMNLS